MSRATVLLNGVPIGSLWSEDGGRASFSFLPGYWDMAQRPVLGQRFEDDPRKVVWSRKHGLPAWFRHLLPEPSTPLRKMLRQQWSLAEDDELGLLLRLGEDLPGAVRILPATADADAPSPEEDDDSDETPIAGTLLRYSLAGVQLKFSMVSESRRLRLPAVGRGGRWIVKVTRGYDHAAQNEHATMSWARSAGFEVPETRLINAADLDDLPEGAVRVDEIAIAVARFDRAEGHRVHQEDLAQVMNVAVKEKYASRYDVVARVVRALLGRVGAEEFVKRLVFVTASGNADAHLKNWSLRYADGHTASWSPLYDQIATVAYPELAPELGLKLCGRQAFRDVNLDAFRGLGRPLELGAKEIDGIVVDTVERISKAWPNAAPAYAEEHRKLIHQHWQRVPLLREFGHI